MNGFAVMINLASLPQIKTIFSVILMLNAVGFAG